MTASEKLADLLALRKEKHELMKDAGKKSSGAYLQGLRDEQIKFSTQKSILKKEILELDQQISQLNRRMKDARGSSQTIVFMRAFYHEAREHLPDEVFKRIKTAVAEKLEAA